MASSRRRRLRLIKTVEERTAKQRRSNPPPLEVTLDTELSRLDVDALRKRLFAECRGNASASVRIDRPDEEPITVVLDRPYLLIGSDPACDLRLDHPEIKARHFYLQWIDGQLFCCDVAQRTSFFPDRNPSANGQWVTDQPISIGPYRLSLVDGNPAQKPDYSPLDRSSQLAAEYPHLGLQFIEVEQSDNLWPVNRMVTMIGRGSQCKLRLNHKSIANVQAALVRTPFACWLIDLVNDGTTGVNERAVTISQVDIGDVLRLGSFQVEVVAMEFQSVIPEMDSDAVLENPFAKPLPPIRFDRQPKSHPRRSTEPAAEPVQNGLWKPAPTDIDDDIGAGNEPTHRRSSETRSKTLSVKFPKSFEKKSSHATPPEAVNRLPVAIGDRRVIENKQAEADGDVLATVLTPVSPAKDSHESVPPHIETVGLDLKSQVVTVAVRIQPGTLSHAVAVDYDIDQSSVDVFSTRVLKHLVDVKIVDRCMALLGDLQRNAKPSPDDGSNVQESKLSAETVATFISEQQSQLASLKLRLVELKQIYDKAAGNLISTRMRDSLEKPVIETMKCYDSMKESLDDFIRSHS